MFKCNWVYRYSCSNCAGLLDDRRCVRRFSLFTGNVYMNGSCKTTSIPSHNQPSYSNSGFSSALPITLRFDYTSRALCSCRCHLIRVDRHHFLYDTLIPMPWHCPDTHSDTAPYRMLLLQCACRQMQPSMIARKINLHKVQYTLAEV